MRNMFHLLSQKHLPHRQVFSTPLNGGTGKVFYTLFSLDRFAGEYKPDGRQFIVVCGNINYESVLTFLEDFFHPARDDVDVEVIFLNKAEPDLEFEGLLKREHTRVQYFK